MANLNQPPSRVTPNLLHILNAFTDSSNTIINTIVELNSNTINKYELITETGHLKLDRVGYSSVGDWHSSSPDGIKTKGRDTRFGGIKQECGIHIND